MLAAVVLAAGASQRMGQAKALLIHRGRSFVGCAVDVAVAGGCDPVFVVEGAHALPAASLAPAQVLAHPGWAAGQLSSLQRGLICVPTSAIGVLVLTVDRPHVQVATVRALVAAFQTDPDGLWQPVFQGRRGHPVIYPAALLPAVLALPAAASVRPVWAEHAARRRLLTVDDPAVVDNLDTPADLHRLER